MNGTGIGLILDRGLHTNTHIRNPLRSEVCGHIFEVDLRSENPEEDNNQMGRSTKFGGLGLKSNFECKYPSHVDRVSIENQRQMFVATGTPRKKEHCIILRETGL